MSCLTLAVTETIDESIQVNDYGTTNARDCTGEQVLVRLTTGEGRLVKEWDADVGYDDDGRGLAWDSQAAGTARWIPQAGYTAHVGTLYRTWWHVTALGKRFPITPQERVVVAP